MYKPNCKICTTILKRNDFPSFIKEEEKKYWLESSEANYNRKYNRIFINLENKDLTKVNSFNNIKNNKSENNNSFDNSKDNNVEPINSINNMNDNMITEDNIKNNSKDNKSTLNISTDNIKDINFTNKEIYALKELANNYLNIKDITFEDKAKRTIRSFTIDDKLYKLIKDKETKDLSKSEIVNRALKFYFMHNKKRE